MEHSSAWHQAIAGAMRAASRAFQNARKLCKQHVPPAVRASHAVWPHKAAHRPCPAIQISSRQLTPRCRPRQPQAAVIVGAKGDRYVDPHSILEMAEHWPGSEVRLGSSMHPLQWLQWGALPAWRSTSSSRLNGHKLLHGHLCTHSVRAAGRQPRNASWLKVCRRCRDPSIPHVSDSGHCRCR